MFGLLFFIVGLGALFLAYVMHQQDQYFKKHVIKIQGRIIEVQETRYKSGRSNRIVHRPLIEYGFQGKTWQYLAEYSVEMERQQVGSAVEVILNPQRPSLVTTEPDMGNKSILILICVGLGIPFIGLGLYLFVDEINKYLLHSEFDVFTNGMAAFGIASLFWTLRPIYKRFKSKRKNTVWGLEDNAQPVDGNTGQTQFG